MSNNISIQSCGRIVLEPNRIDIYLVDPIQISNINALDNIFGISVISGSLVATSFPLTGLDIYNRNLGAIANINLATSGINYYTSFFDMNIRKFGVAISGSKVIGRK